MSVCLCVCRCVGVCRCVNVANTTVKHTVLPLDVDIGRCKISFVIIMKSPCRSLIKKQFSLRGAIQAVLSRSCRWS